MKVHIVVEVADQDGNLIEKVGDEFASWERTLMRRGDEYKGLIGDGHARVSFSIGERLGGPYGYSSISTNVTVTLTCNQDTKTIARAEDMAIKEAFATTDDVIPQAYRMLETHLQQHYRERQ